MRRWFATLFFLSVCASAVLAQDKPQLPEKESSSYDKFWRLADLYDDANNPVVQRIAFTGRFHFDYASVDADQGETTEWNVRRLRLGPHVTIFRTVTIHIEVDLNPQEQDPTYVRLTDAYIAWTPDARLTLTVGKHGAPFTSDGSTSSKELLTIDRSNIANNIWFSEEYVPGLSLSGHASPWNYRVGVYSAGAANREFGVFNGGVFTLGALGYDFATAAGMREASVTANYVYQQRDIDNTFTQRHGHVASVHVRLDTGRWGFRGGVSKSSGYLGQRDLWGLMAMPYLSLTETIQIVGRYTFLESDGSNGILLATYENRVGAGDGSALGDGDQYHEAYAGVNYYFYGHRLKLQSGVQFADMRDRADDGGAYSGTSWVTGLRVGW